MHLSSKDRDHQKAAPSASNRPNEFNTADRGSSFVSDPRNLLRVMGSILSNRNEHLNQEKH